MVDKCVGAIKLCISALCIICELNFMGRKSYPHNAIEQKGCEVIHKALTSACTSYPQIFTG